MNVRNNILVGAQTSLILVCASLSMLSQSARGAGQALAPDAELRIPDEGRYEALNVIYEKPVPDPLPLLPKEWFAADLSMGWRRKVVAVAKSIADADRDAGVADAFAGDAGGMGSYLNY